MNKVWNNAATEFAEKCTVKNTKKNAKKTAGEINMRHKVSIKQLLIAGFAGLMLTACGSDKTTTLQDSLNEVGSGTSVVNTTSGFNPDPTAPNLPFPINVLFSGTTDLTLNIPVEDAADLSDPKVAMNALDGFSTSAPITSGAFTGSLDAASLASAVRVFEVALIATPTAPIAGPVGSIIGELTFGVDFVASLSSVDPSSSTIAIVPLKPLKPKTSYYVVITDDLKDTDGNTVGTSSAYLLTKGFLPLIDADGNSQTSSLSDAQAAALEPLRIITSVSEQTLAADTSISPALSGSDIILSWSFTTQSISDVLAATREQDRALTTTSGFNPVAATVSPQGGANIHIGTLQLPYYLTASSTATSPSNDPTALGSCWNGGVVGTCADGPHTTAINPAPAMTSTQTVQMMVSIPGAACPTGMPVTGWPVVIYQHGITSNRATMLALADSMAAACTAIVAIDLPLHGITGSASDVSTGIAAFKNPAIAGGERTFDLDLVEQDAEGSIVTDANGVPAPPDGVIDTSGTHFINLSNLLNTRDNVRQAVSDLFVMVDAIEEGTVTDGTNIMDKDKIYFLGHSLGAIVGTPFLALEPDVRDAALVFGGGQLPKILDGSAAFGPTIAGGLAVKGVLKGTADYESFIGAAQTVVDSSDPVNFGVDAATGRGILFVEIAGGSTSPSDLVVPNTVPDANDTSGTVPAPLAGTEPLIALMGLSHESASQGPGTDDLKVATKFVVGNHSSLLSPADTTVPPSVPGENLKVTTEIQTQVANFLGSDGKVLKVTDSSLLLAP